MASHLGKRRALELDDEAFTHPVKRANLTSSFSPGPAQQQQQHWQPPQSPAQQQSTFVPSASPFGAEHAATGVDPAQCTDLVVYKPPQQLPGIIGFGAAGSAPQGPQQQQLLQHLQEQAQMLESGHNNNAALKSVWRSLTPAQRRSLAGMWDVIKSEELLPRLIPHAGLLKLPSYDLDDTQQRQHHPNHCIIEEVDDDNGSSKQQQQQGALGAAGFVQQPGMLLNGFTSPPVPAAAVSDGMLVDGAGPAAAAAAAAGSAVDLAPQGSVEDMEM